MTEHESLPLGVVDLIDDYLDGLLDEARTAELEESLLASVAAREYFVRYARLHTDLHIRERARHASQCALDRIAQMSASGNHAAAAVPASPEAIGVAAGQRREGALWRASQWIALSAALILLLAVGVGWWLTPQPPHGGDPAQPAIAWLVNAQNCQWSDDVDAAADMQAGKLLNLRRGLAEVQFQCGARVLLEGPASLELLTGTSARLRHGKLTAKVPGPAVGFEILSPQGKVIDLGTEFGVFVSAEGVTRIQVFEGQVKAHADDDNGVGVSVMQNESALLRGGKVTLNPREPADESHAFVRAIVPPPVIVPRTLRLGFDSSLDESLADVHGLGTGFTHRLPGTGHRVPLQDPNLRLDPSQAQLELTTTRSDINNQVRLGMGEYLGVRLADLGFTGREDFAVAATISNTPDLEDYGQFGLYAGTRSDRNIRGGLIKWGPKDAGQNTQFMVNNHGGRDTDVYKVGLLSPGADLRLTLQRSGGKYSLSVENLTDGGASTLTIRHPEFLDSEAGLCVGLFGANPYSDVRKTIVIKEFSATVWTMTPPANTVD